MDGFLFYSTSGLICYFQLSCSYDMLFSNHMAVLWHVRTSSPSTRTLNVDCCYHSPSWSCRQRVINSIIMSWHVFILKYSLLLQGFIAFWCQSLQGVLLSRWDSSSAWHIHFLSLCFRHSRLSLLFHVMWSMCCDQSQRLLHLTYSAHWF